jgi:hypothetical protein
MLSQRYYIEKKRTNNSIWKLHNLLGRKFESHICAVLKEELSEYYDLGVKIRQTSATRDGGRDIIIESTVDLPDVLCTDFHIGKANEMKIYIECKSSDGYLVSYDNVASNLDRIKSHNVQYYVLVTNTTVVPYAYHMLKTKCKELGVHFVLIDQFLLHSYLSKKRALIGEVGVIETEEGLYFEYQILTLDNDGSNHEIYLLVRNYKDSNEMITLNLYSDVNWNIASSDEIKFIVNPNSYNSIRLDVNYSSNGGIDELKILLKSYSSEHSVKIKGIKRTNVFAPPLHGKIHKAFIEEISAFFTVKDGLAYYLFGEAGTGKTRILDEVHKKLSEKNISIFRVLCTKNEALVKQKLLAFLNNEGFLDDLYEDTALIDVITHINCKGRKCLIILDDLHNLISMLNDIKQILNSKLPDNFKILFVGRDDFSMGSVNYFNFLQWCLTEDGIRGKKLNCMDDEDSTGLIKSIIQEVPEIVLDRIKNASNNNPLFIIQFIEYLLETNVGVLVSRSAIGINNIAEFSAKDYIPANIESLYKMRIDNLLNTDRGGECVEFLYIYAALGVQLSQDKLPQEFENKSEVLQVLRDRNFITFRKDHTSNIIHESLYLFLKNKLLNDLKMYKKIAKKILGLPLLLNDLSNFEKGELYFYSGDVQTTRNFFKPIINFCRNIENFTAVNIEIEYYEYLEIVYRLLKNDTDVNTLKNLFMCRISTTLHYYTPVRAIDECEIIEVRAKENTYLRDDVSFFSEITVLKAHSCVNAGRLKTAEKYFVDLLASCLIQNDCIDDKSKFDMYDRLCGLYIRYNSYTLAEKFNKMAIHTANEIGSDALLGLTEITKAKMKFYINQGEAYEHLIKAKKHLLISKTKRNLSHNNITLFGYKAIKHSNEPEKLNELKSELLMCLNEAVTNIYPSLIIRCYLVLAIVDFLQDCNGKYNLSKMWIQKGINASIQYGIASYIWMFYNQQLIISTNLNEDYDYRLKIVSTIHRLLKRQNLLNIMGAEITYANIPVITNILKFYAELCYEKEFNRILNGIDYIRLKSTCNFACKKSLCAHSCVDDDSNNKKQYERIINGKLLFADERNCDYKFVDKKSGYFIVFA